MSPRRGIGPLACALWLGLASVGHAQTEPLSAGRDVRLFVRGVIAPFEGRLTTAGPEALTLTLLDGSEFTISAEQLQRSEVLGTRRNVVRGAVIGGGLGLALGVGLVVAARNDCSDQPSGYCDEFGRGFDGWRLVIPPLAGAATGGLVGHFIRTPEWFPGFLPSASPDGGVAFGLAWTIHRS